MPIWGALVIQNQENRFIYENHILAKWVASLYENMHLMGYEHVQVPAIEATDIFLIKAGDEIIANLFTFERFGKEYSLRPEFTALAAHRYAQTHPDGDRVVRWQFNGSVFRDEHTQRNTQYQQMSIGAELIGMHSPLADAEVIYIAVSGLRDVLQMADFHVDIGHVELTRQALKQFALDEPIERVLLSHMSANIDKQQLLDMLSGSVATEDTQTTPNTEISLDVQASTQKMLDVILEVTQSGGTMGGRSRSEIVQRLLMKQRYSAQRTQIAEAIAFLSEWSQLSGQLDTAFEQIYTLLPRTSAIEQVTQKIQSTLDILYKMGVPPSLLRFSPSLIREWNYYTGFVFELKTNDNRRLGGGGRYDEMVRLMGANKDVPAVGFAYYMDEILKHQPLTDKRQASPAPTTLYAEDFSAQAWKWIINLRKRGLPVQLCEAAEQATVRVNTDGQAEVNDERFALAQLDALIERLTNKGVH